VELRRLPERQLVIRTGMVTAPRERGLKASGEAPTERGYEIFVASRDADATASHPPALVTLELTPAGEPPDLILSEGEPERSWSFTGRSGESVSVRVRAGAGAPLAEISTLLSAVRELLAGAGR